MRIHANVLLATILGLLCACGGGGTPTITSIAQAKLTVNAPSGDARSIQLGLQPMSATLPVVSQITGTLLFPAVGTPTTILLSASATVPAGVMSENMLRAQGGTVTVLESFTIVSATKVTLPSIPAMTLNFPTSKPLAGKSIYYGISGLNAQGGLVRLVTQGPGIITGQTVSFAQGPATITFEAGQKYTFVVYAPLTNIGARKIYVLVNDTVTTYNADGTQPTPTITAGLTGASAIAVDANGKIYVAATSGSQSAVTTYNANGTQTTPTITAGLSYPSAIAVDANGKIYVANSGGNVTTYFANGKRTTPTITGINAYAYLGGLAVDAAGKIHVASFSTKDGSGTALTYRADGTRTSPTITCGPTDYSFAIAVDAAGKIYILNSRTFNSSVTTYNANGKQTTPTITSGLDNPGGLAVDAAGKIYVANVGNLAFPTVTTYNPDGSESIPTILAGSGRLSAIAVR